MNDSNKSCAESTKPCFKCGLSKARTDFYMHPLGNEYASRLAQYIKGIK